MKMRWASVCLLSLGFGAAAMAGVPNRVVYQGRLSKTGVSVSGAHTFRARIYPMTQPGTSLWQSELIPLTLSATGEFSLVLNVDANIDWLSSDPRLELTVDGEKFTPDETFGTSPYAFAARTIEAGGVNTAALQNAAVTDVKVSTISAAKIMLPGTSSPMTVWQSTVAGQTDKIDASKIFGSISTFPGAHAASHAAGGSDALSNLSRTQVAGTALVANSTFTQVLQAVSVSTSVLAVKGVAGSGSKIIQVYDSGVLGNTGSLPTEQAWFDKDANFVTNKAVTAASIVAASGNVAVLTVEGETVSGLSTLNRVLASSVTVAGPLRVTGGIRDQYGAFLPVGSVIAYGGANVPADTGWLLCDGRDVSRSTYADLFAAIGTTHGAGNGATTFNLPDLRGASPAGAGTSVGYVENETIPLGAKLNDRVQGHRHLIKEQNGDQVLGTTLAAVGGGSGTVEGPNAHAGINRGNTEARDLLSDGLNGVPRIGPTTRGKVVGVNFIIKY